MAQETTTVEKTSSSPTPYEEVLDRLSSLIIRRTRVDGSNKADHLDVMFDYYQILELEEPISRLNVIHVAGTKGKGSTCTFTESILRHCGFRTGLFMSPHLIDIRERFKIDGVDISEEKFISYFWWCWDRLQEKINDDVPMPTYFRFLALLGLKIFAAEQVDVAILEVGLGGKYDATNAVKTPVVCGITSLGYDHTELLGNTLRQIAGEKAGIFKQGTPAYTVPQPEEAMSVLKDNASNLATPLRVVSPLDKGLLKGQRLGLRGEHQYLNAGLAVALACCWLQRTGRAENIILNNAISLPEEFVRGLTMADLPGRSQVVPDPDICTRNMNSGLEGIVFYLDGAHSPESLEVCARWFSHVVEEEIPSDQETDKSCETKQILLFNCMSVRDPQLLLPPLLNTCTRQGIHFDKAIFVPNQSAYNKVGSHATPQSESQQVDLSWQLTIQRVWESLVHGDKGLGKGKILEPPEDINTTKGGESSSVFPSLPVAIKWLRDNAQQNRSIRYQVLVTGSLHLVGDVLKLIKK